MYDFLRGRVARKLPTAIVLDVGGVGWFVETSLRTSGAVRLGADATLWVHHRQTEDSVRLFGFHDEEERDLFRRLLKTTGVGPAHALALCSAFAPDQIWDAIAGADERRLSSPKGIGPKLAQRLISELKDEAVRRVGVGGRTPAGGAAGAATSALPADDAVDALTVLGYTEAAAQKAVQLARKRVGAAAPVEDVLREALRAAT